MRPHNSLLARRFSSKRETRHKILQAEYCNADRTTGNLTLQDINTTPKELKTEHRITPYHVSSGGQESKCQIKKNLKGIIGFLSISPGQY